MTGVILVLEIVSRYRGWGHGTLLQPAGSHLDKSGTTHEPRGRWAACFHRKGVEPVELGHTTQLPVIVSTLS